MRFFDYITIDKCLMDPRHVYSFHHSRSLSAKRWKDILFDIYLAEDVFEAAHSWYGLSSNERHSPIPIPDYHVDHAICKFFFGGGHAGGKTMVSLYRNLRSSQSNRVCILSAHGGVKDGSWIYSENKKVVEPIQEWVNRVATTPTLFMQDEHYGALVILACNEDNCKLTSPLPGIAVYYPTGIVGCGFNRYSITCSK